MDKTPEPEFMPEITFKYQVVYPTFRDFSQQLLESYETEIFDDAQRKYVTVYKVIDKPFKSEVKIQVKMVVESAWENYAEQDKQPHTLTKD